MAFFNAGSSRLARIAIMDMTMRSSTNVNHLRRKELRTSQAVPASGLHVWIFLMRFSSCFPSFEAGFMEYLLNVK